MAQPAGPGLEECAAMRAALHRHRRQVSQSHRPARLGAQGFSGAASTPFLCDDADIDASDYAGMPIIS